MLINSFFHEINIKIRNKLTPYFYRTTYSNSCLNNVANKFKIDKETIWYYR